MPQKGPRDSREHLLLIKWEHIEVWDSLDKGNSQCESFGLVWVSFKQVLQNKVERGEGGKGTFSYAKQINQIKQTPSIPSGLTD